MWAFKKKKWQKCKSTLDYNRRELLKHESGATERKRERFKGWVKVYADWVTFCSRSLFSASRHLTASLAGALKKQLCTSGVGWISHPHGHLNMVYLKFKNVRNTEGVIEEFKSYYFSAFAKTRKSIFLQMQVLLMYFDSLTAASSDSDSTFPPLLSELQIH